MSRHALLEAIHKHMAERVELTGEGSGAHIVLWPAKRISEDAAVAAAAARAVGVYGVSRYFLKGPTRPGLMLGYPRMRESDIREGVRRLAQTL